MTAQHWGIIRSLVGLTILVSSVFHAERLIAGFAFEPTGHFAPFMSSLGKVGICLSVLQALAMLIGGILLLTCKTRGFLLLYISFFIMLIFARPVVYLPLPRSVLSPISRSIVLLGMNLVVFIAVVCLHLFGRKQTVQRP